MTKRRCRHVGRRRKPKLERAVDAGGVNAVRKNESYKQFCDSAVCRVGRGLDVRQVAATLTGPADDSTSWAVRRCSGGQ